MVLVLVSALALRYPVPSPVSTFFTWLGNFVPVFCHSAEEEVFPDLQTQNYDHTRLLRTYNTAVWLKIYGFFKTVLLLKVIMKFHSIFRKAVFYKQVLIVHHPSKILGQTSRRQNHWPLLYTDLVCTSRRPPKKM